MKQLTDEEAFETFRLELENLIHKVKLHIDRDNCQCCAKATGLAVGENKDGEQFFGE